MLLRLGLRAGEVAALTLEDIDWRAGEITVHGKGRRDERLPLPDDVGAGDRRLADPRPRRSPGAARCSCGGRTRRAAGRGGVSYIVRRACQRAGVAPVGAHRLRHTAACRDGRRRACPLAEIGQVLRHRAWHDRELRPGQHRGAAETGPALAGRWSGMSDLRRHLEDYLRLRRALGFKLAFPGRCCPASIGYLEAAGAGTITTELAIAWAGLPRGVLPITWAQRLGAVRGFARYLKTIDPAAEVPPAGLWPRSLPRPQP